MSDIINKIFAKSNTYSYSSSYSSSNANSATYTLSPNDPLYYTTYANYDPGINNYLNNIPSLNTITGSIPLPYYQNLNLDSDIQNRMVKYYKKKLSKWLRGDLKDILDNVKISGDNNDKIKYIENIINKSYILMILTIYINKTGSSWINLTKNNEFIKDLFRYKINKKLKNQ
jgi:hypothetical protein